GSNSHDQPTTSPRCSVSITSLRPGACTSSATMPSRIRKKCSAASPWRKSIAPAGKRSLTAQAAISRSWSCESPANVGAAAISSSRPRIAHRLAVADRPRLLGDVDADRAPRDAAPAAHAPGAAELVDPGGQLVGHPLAIARARGRTHRAPVDVGVVHREARVPALVAPPVLARQVGHVLHARTEAGGAHHRAVPAREAALGHLIPARVLEVAIQQVPDVCDVEL